VGAVHLGVEGGDRRLPEILKELKLALQECGRDVGRHISRRRREADAEKKKSYIETYLPHVGIALAEILALTEPQQKETFEKLVSILERSRKP